jgi:hypothetical protein
MATRYWVGGTGTWDASATAHWSASSGGAGGASVPLSTDDVIINTGSGTGTVTITGTRVCRSLNWNRSSLALARTLDTDFIQVGVGGVVLTSITFGANITTSTPWNKPPITCQSSWSSGVSIPWAFAMNGGTLASNISCLATTDMLWDGTDLNGYTVIGKSLNVGGGTSTSGTMGTGTIRLNGTGTVFYSSTTNPTTNLAHDQSGVTIEVNDTSAAAKTVNLYGRTTGKLTHAGGGVLTVGNYAGTITEVAVSGATTGKEIAFPGGTTMVVDTLPSGSAANPITLKSTSGVTNATVNGSSGAISHLLSNVTLTRMTISVGTGEAYDSSDGGNNVGWLIRNKVPSLFFGADL